MKDLDTALDAVRVAIAAAEALSDAIDAAKKALDAGTQKLKDVLADAEKERSAMHEKLAHDRKEERDAFDTAMDAQNAAKADDDVTKP